MGLEPYKKKRNFKATPEPPGDVKEAPLPPRIFVVQEHHATHLHYDLRFESDGVLRSWAVPKGVPEKPGERHLAVETEDHPLSTPDLRGPSRKESTGPGK